MNVYRPDIAKQVKLNFVNKNNPNLYQPWKGLEFYYFKNGNNFLNIPTNTQLSEFLNKFNESDILPRLGEYKLNEINFGRSFILNPKLIVNDFGWNWINWNSKEGKKVLNNLEEIFNGKKFLVNDLDRNTLKVLGRLKLKDSTDYGKKVEADFNQFLEQYTEELEDVSLETKEIYNHLNSNDYTVIAYKVKFVHPEAIFSGEIDYILINKKTKKIHLADLKTSSSANNYDYWRQLSVYFVSFLALNPHLKNHISDQLVIIHVNNLKDDLKSHIYHKNINENNLKLFAEEAINFKRSYLEQLINWKD